METYAVSLSTNHSKRIRRATAVFVVASSLDLFLTCELISRPIDDSGAQFIEANPVAAYFLVLAGAPGLAGFKVAMMALVATACRVIAARRIVTAHRILNFAAVAGAVVVIYSAGLAMHCS